MVRSATQQPINTIGGINLCCLDSFYARRYAARHKFSPDGLAVAVRYEIGGRPARVNQIGITITPPTQLPAERRDAFLAVASHCTVHNTLTEPPNIEIALAADVLAGS